MPRRIWVYSRCKNGKVKKREVGQNWKPSTRNNAVNSYTEEARTYAGAKATDGTPIDTKRKHREYLKRGASPHEEARGELAMSQDFGMQRDGSIRAGSFWDRKQKERDAYRGADGKNVRHPDRAAIREAVRQAWYKHTGE